MYRVAYQYYVRNRVEFSRRTADKSNSASSTMVGPMSDSEGLHLDKMLLNALEPLVRHLAVPPRLTTRAARR